VIPKDAKKSVRFSLSDVELSAIVSKTFPGYDASPEMLALLKGKLEPVIARHYSYFSDDALDKIRSSVDPQEVLGNFG
jgi:hypothetical protein